MHPLLIVGCVLLLLALHPFATYAPSLALLAWLRPRPVTPVRGVLPQRVAVCLCAYNEESVIAGRIENLLAARDEWPGLEILVYVDGAVDGTLSALAPFGGRITVAAGRARLGKTHGMQVLVGMTSADVLVFTDANVSFAPGAVPALVAGFADPEVGCVCGHLRYAADPAAGSTARIGSLYWRLEERIKALESNTGSVMGADGSIFAARRTLYRAPPARLIDDMFVSLSILIGGARIVRAPEAVAFEPPVGEAGEEFARKRRIACQAFNVHRALLPGLRRLSLLDKYKYTSHKLLRWLSLPLAGAAGLFIFVGLAIDGLWKPALAALVVLPILAMAAIRARGGPLARLREIILALLATTAGIVRSLRGDQFQIWTPPASSRSTLKSQLQV